jgi:hypothetical protein
MPAPGRLGQPEDIADLVAFLASDEARMITGQGLRANGGLSPPVSPASPRAATMGCWPVGDGALWNNDGQPDR